MTQSDVQVLAQIDVAFGPIGDLIAACKFKQALGEVMALAREVNKYLDETAPWFTIKIGQGAHRHDDVRGAAGN